MRGRSRSPERVGHAGDAPVGRLDQRLQLVGRRDGVGEFAAGWAGRHWRRRACRPGRGDRGRSRRRGWSPATGPARPRVSVTVSTAPEGLRTVTGVGGVGHGLALDGQFAGARLGAQRLLLEVGLLHQPVRQPAQQVDMRAAALVAARPQPGMVGEQQRDAALADAVQHQQRLVVGAVHDDVALRLVDVDQAEAAAPVRRVGLRAFEVAGHRMALAEVGDGRVVGLLDAPCRSAPAGSTGDSGVS